MKLDFFFSHMSLIIPLPQSHAFLTLAAQIYRLPLSTSFRVSDMIFDQSLDQNLVGREYSNNAQAK